MLQSIAVCFSVLIDINLVDLLQKGSEDTESAGALQCVAVRCSVLQCVAVCCSVIQYVP